MDFNEFETTPTGLGSRKYGKDVEFVIEELNRFSSAAGRYSRDVQAEVALTIVKHLRG